MSSTVGVDWPVQVLLSLGLLTFELSSLATVSRRILIHDYNALEDCRSLIFGRGCLLGMPHYSFPLRRCISHRQSLLSSLCAMQMGIDSAQLTRNQYMQLSSVYRRRSILRTSNAPQTTASVDAVYCGLDMSIRCLAGLSGTSRFQIIHLNLLHLHYLAGVP